MIRSFELPRSYTPQTEITVSSYNPYTNPFMIYYEGAAYPVATEHLILPTLRNPLRFRDENTAADRYHSSARRVYESSQRIKC